MLSLDNAFGAEDFAEFLARARRFLGLAADAPLQLVAEPKIDGCRSTYSTRTARFVRGATRGDGAEGEDVTANLRTMQAVPHRLRGDAPALIEIRGEVFLAKADFLALNAGAGGGRAAALRQPAQRRRRVAAPARPGA